MDEIKLFEDLQPPALPDAPRLREAARARLTAAASVPPTRHRRTAVAVATAAAVVAAGTGYGISASQGGGTASPNPGAGGGSGTVASTVAGVTAVHGCPGWYITAGALKQVSGAQLVLQPANDFDHANRDWRAKPVTADTSASTAITRPANGSVNDITDGSHVFVQGNWSGRRLAATEVGIEAALPPPTSFGPHFPRLPGHVLKHLGPQGMPGPPFGAGTVTDVHDGGFTVVTQNPVAGTQRIQVITSGSTKVLTRVSTGLSQLSPGANVVVVGQMGAHGVLNASTVAEPSVMEMMLAGGPVKIRTSGCSASAITTAAILSGR